MSMETVVLIALGWTTIGCIVALALGKFLRTANPMGYDRTNALPAAAVVSYLKKNKPQVHLTQPSTHMRHTA